MGESELQSNNHPKLYFVNCGNGPQRNWADCRKYGFISAGQPRDNLQGNDHDLDFYSSQLNRLKINDIAAIYFNGYGYVAIGKVTALATRINDFRINGKRVTSDMFDKDTDMFKNCDNPSSEYLVKMDWLPIEMDWPDSTFHETDAFTYPGIFQSRHVVCLLNNQLRLIKKLQEAFKINPDKLNLVDYLF